MPLTITFQMKIKHAEFSSTEEYIALISACNAADKCIGPTGSSVTKRDDIP